MVRWFTKIIITREQSGSFIIFLSDFMAFNIRFSKSSIAIASILVSVVMSFIFETAMLLSTVSDI